MLHADFTHANVQHIEPQHVAGVPVPLAPDDVQEEAHRLVTEAAAMRTEASTELRAVIREIEEAAGLPPIPRRSGAASPDTSLVKASALAGRLDGLFHIAAHHASRQPSAKERHRFPILHDSLSVAEGLVRARAHRRRKAVIGGFALVMGTAEVTRLSGETARIFRIERVPWNDPPFGRASRIVTRSCILATRPGASPRDRHSLDPDR